MSATSGGSSGSTTLPPAVQEKLEKMTNLLKSAQTAISTLKAENERLKKENEGLQDKVKKLEEEKKTWKKPSEAKSPSGPMTNSSPKIVMKKAPLEPKLKTNIANSMMSSTSLGGVALNVPIIDIKPEAEEVKLNTAEIKLPAEPDSSKDKGVSESSDIAQIPINCDTGKDKKQKITKNPPPQPVEHVRKKIKLGGYENIAPPNTSFNKSMKITNILQQVSEENYRVVAKALLSYPYQAVKREFLNFVQSEIVSLDIKKEWIRQAKLLMDRKSVKSIPNLPPALSSKLKALVKTLLVMIELPENSSSQFYGLEILFRLRGRIISASRNYFGINHQWSLFTKGTNNMDIGKFMAGLLEQLPQQSLFHKRNTDLASGDNEESRTLQEDVTEEIEQLEEQLSDSDFDTDDEEDKNDTIMDVENANSSISQDKEVESDDDYESFEKLLERKLAEKQESSEKAIVAPTTEQRVVANEVKQEDSTSSLSSTIHLSHPTSATNKKAALDELLLAKDFSDFCIAYVLLYTSFQLQSSPGRAHKMLKEILDDFIFVVNLSLVPGVCYALIQLIRDFSLLPMNGEKSAWIELMKYSICKSHHLNISLKNAEMSPKVSNEEVKKILYEKLQDQSLQILGLLKYELEKVESSEHVEKMLSESNSSIDSFCKQDHAEMKLLIHMLPVLQTHGYLPIVQSWLCMPMMQETISNGTFLGVAGLGQSLSNLSLSIDHNDIEYANVYDHFQRTTSFTIPNLKLSSILDDEILRLLEQKSSDRSHNEFESLLHETDLMEAFVDHWKILLGCEEMIHSKKKVIMSLDDLLDGNFDDDEMQESSVQDKLTHTTTQLQALKSCLESCHTLVLRPLLQNYDGKSHGWRSGNIGEGVKLTVVMYTRIGVLRNLLSRLSVLAHAPHLLRRCDLSPLEYMESIAAGFFFHFSSVSLEEVVEVIYLLTYAWKEILSRPDRINSLLFSSIGGNKEYLYLIERIVSTSTELLHYLGISYMERFLHIHCCNLRALLKVMIEVRKTFDSSAHQELCGVLINLISQQLIFLPAPWGCSNRADIQFELQQVYYSSFPNQIPTQSQWLNFFCQQTSKLPTFLVNLDRRPDRLKKCILQADLSQLNLVRVTAIDGKSQHKNGNDMLQLLKSNESISATNMLQKISKLDIALSWNTSLNHLFDKNCPPNSDVNLSDSEIACAASHLKCWRYIALLHELYIQPGKDVKATMPRTSRQVLFSDAEFDIITDMWPRYFQYYQGMIHMMHSIPIESSTNKKLEFVSNAKDYDDFYLIFEDDMHIKTSILSRFNEEVHKIVHRARAVDWDIIYLGAALPSSSSHFKYSFFKGGYFMKVNYAWMLHGYILRGKSAAKLLSKLPIVGPVDNFIARLIHDGELNAIVLGDYIVEQNGRMNERLSDSNIVRSQNLSSSTFADNTDYMDTTNNKFKLQRKSKSMKRKKNREHKKELNSN